MMTSYETIVFEKADGIRRLILNRPQNLNAFNRPMLAEIIAVLDDVRDDPAARVLVISGNGRGFCSGADLSAGGGPPAPPGGHDSGQIIEQYVNPIIERLFALPLPVVASVHGAVAGAGCMLALSADIVLAARSAYFLQAFVNVGLVPDAGSTWLLPRLVGRARAQAMMMLGERIPASTASEWGLIFEAVDDAALSARTEAIVGKLAAGPTRTYALIRHGIRNALEQSLSQVLAAERQAQLQAGRTADFREGVAAFRERRTPQYTGR